MTDSSHLIVILARPNLVVPDNPYVAKSFGRRRHTREMLVEIR